MTGSSSRSEGNGGVRRRSEGKIAAADRSVEIAVEFACSVCSSICAPRGVQRRDWRLSKRLSTIWVTADSTKPVGRSVPRHGSVHHNSRCG
jgi:hypothetical protein